MKNIFLNISFALLLIIAGCSGESFVNEQQTGDEPVLITLTTSMPEEGPRTRISLERDNLNISLKWEENDQLEFCLKYGDAIEKQVITVSNISADRKTADFSLALPAGDYETFDLYGVYGGGGLEDADPTKAILPSATSSTSGSLDDLKTNEVVMLTFAKTGIDRKVPDLSVDLEHMGSLFCIQLRNTGTTPWYNVKKVQLSAASPISAHNNTGSALFDLTTGTFSGTISGNELIFELSSATDLPAGGLQEFWGWYPPVSGQTWPEISLKVIDGSEAELAQSVNSKPTRTAATAAGKVFYFPAVYDGTELEFIDTTPLTDIDGNVYTTVVIGDLEWMTENLRVTRYRNGDPIARDLSNTEWAATNNGRLGAYAVYPYTETNGMVSSEAEMIAKYGLLYNGFAVEDARGLAPEGWRVPTDEDFKNLERAIGMPEALLNGEGWRGNAGDRYSLKLRSTTSWAISGTDDIGFKALSAGIRSEDGGYGFFFGNESRTAFWASTNSPGTDLRGYRRILQNNNQNSIARNVYLKQHGESVRCVRDRSR